MTNTHKMLWILQHKTNRIDDALDVVTDKHPDDWYTMHKFDATNMCQLKDFQPCCSQFETSHPRLSRIPKCIIKTEKGDISYVINGTLFMKLRSDEYADLDWKFTNLSDEKLNRILKSLFDIRLNEPLGFHNIMKTFLLDK